MTVRSLTIGVAFLALAVVPAACGESETTLNVSLSDYQLKPRNPQLDGPAEVRFRVRNVGSVPHALTVVGPKEEVETEPVAPGGTTEFSLDLDEPGRYRWFCPVGDHRGRGMRGRITVDG
jgi:uncharacterized cupredoxin-like copper-binding protein